MTSPQPSPYQSGVSVVTSEEINALAAQVAAYEQQFGLPSADMFDGDNPVVSTLEEDNELHEWLRAWIRLNALRKS
jgi:hypothetical protein